jgi:uncharacterized membrane protein
MGALRRVIGDILLAFGLIMATIATLAYLSIISFFSPVQIAKQANMLASNPAIQSAVADSLANVISPYADVQGIVISHSQLQTAVATALKNPVVKQEFIQALQTADEHLLGKSKQPITLGGPVFDSVIVQEIAPYSTALASTLSHENLQVSIPGADLPNLGIVARSITSIEKIATTLAVVTLLLALVFHPARPSVLKRIAAWMISIAAFDVIIFWLVPVKLLPLIKLSWAQIAAVLLKAEGAPALSFYVKLLIGGGILFLLSRAAKALA